MLENKKGDLLPLLVMLESVEKILLYIRGFDNAQDFFMTDDQVKFNASLLLLSNIGEYCGNISTELKEKHSAIAWKQIRGLRNRIAHDYIGIDYEMVFNLICNDLPKLKENFEKILKSELKTGNFDIEECKAAQQSIYYRHINFNDFTD